MLVLVMTYLGGQSRAYYEKVMAWLGYTNLDQRVGDPMSSFASSSVMASSTIARLNLARSVGAIASVAIMIELRNKHTLTGKHAAFRPYFARSLRRFPEPKIDI